MKEVGSCNELEKTWPNVAGEHHGVAEWFLAFLRLLGNELRAATLWIAGFFPLYVVVEAALRDFQQTVAPVSYVPLIGIGISFIYLPFYLTSSPERRLSMTMGLLIGFGLVAGLVGVWIST